MMDLHANLRLLHAEQAIINRVLDDNPMEVRLLLLTDSRKPSAVLLLTVGKIRKDGFNTPEDSAKGLCLHALVPPRVDVYDSVGCGEVEALSSALKIRDEDLHVGSLLLESLRDMIACLR